MKFLIKPIAILLLGVYSFALGQDEYPYFSDSKKQLEFEEIRIYVNGPSIIKNGRTLTELEFLENIGLPEKANEIRNDLSEKIKVWENSFPDSVNNPNYGVWMGLGGCSSLIGVCGLLLAVDYEKNVYKILALTGSILFLTEYILGVPEIFWENKKEQIMENNIPDPFLWGRPIPTLQQTLTNEQIKSLAESYNKRIYEEIKNAN